VPSPRLALTALLLLISGVLCPLLAQAAPADSAALRIARGKRLFEAKGLCFSCHGALGEGVLGPNTRLDGLKVWLHSKGTHPEIVALIKTGIEATKAQNGTAMPPRGGSRLTDAEVELVAAYVVVLHQHKPTP
jgi:mono/diheme cytochrome c family protein